MEKQLYPEVAIGTFILNRQGKLLLVTSYKWPSLYAVPGGHMELGESVAETARREAKEEVGLDVRFKRVLNLQEAVYPKGFHEKRHFIFIDVLCIANGEKVRLDNDEIQSYIWVGLRQALRLKLNPYTRVAVRQLIAGKKSAWFYPHAKRA